MANAINTSLLREQERLSAFENVMFLDHEARPGGAQLALLRLLESVSESDIPVRIVLLSEGDMADRYRALGCAVHVVDTGEAARASRNDGHRSLAAGVLRMVPAARMVRSLIHQYGCSTLHMNTPKSWLVGSIATAGTGAVRSYHVRDALTRDAFSKISLFALRSLVRYVADATVSNSLYTQSTAVPKPGEKDVVIPSPAAVSGLTRQRSNSGSTRLICVSRLDSWKGQDAAIKLLAGLRSEGHEVELNIVGSEVIGGQGLEAKLVKLAGQLGVADHVNFLGWRDDVPELLTESDLFIHLPSRPEPLGQVVIEAMSVGLPVVTYDSGGPAELIEDGHNGMLIDPQNPASTIARISALLEDNETMTRIGSNAQHAAKQFTPRHVSDSFAAYLRVLSS